MSQTGMFLACLPPISPQCSRVLCKPQRSSCCIVVIDQVADLSADDQQALFHWLARHHDAMVLSFTEKPLFPLVMHGKFSERLFYRLNMLTLSVDDEAG